MVHVSNYGHIWQNMCYESSATMSEFGQSWMCLMELWPEHTGRFIRPLTTYLSTLKHNQVPDKKKEKTRQRVCIDLSTYRAHTRAED